MRKMPFVAAGFGFVVIILLFSYILRNKDSRVTGIEPSTPTQIMLGGDEDEHGCKASAGYTWCEIKQKCLRTFEEACETPTPDSSDEEQIKKEIKAAIVEKHGESSKNLTITVTEVTGDYAKGGASEAGMGGGMWFGAMVNGSWKLVWDGNGIIKCSDLTDYPYFPVSMIPQCYDDSTQKMVERQARS